MEKIIDDYEGGIFVGKEEGRIVFCKNIYEIPNIIDIEICFTFKDSNIYTVGHQLVIESMKMIDSLDSPYEIHRYTRPQIIIIEGILSYFTGHLFTIYEHEGSEIQLVKKEVGTLRGIESVILKFDGLDHSQDLTILLEKLKEQRYESLIITLLDRWRKALYMLSESEVDTFHDEAILAYFHILELIVGCYYNDFKMEASEEIKRFLTDFSSDILNQSDIVRENTINSKFNILKEVLINNEATISTKINYFLKRHGLLDERTISLVSKIVKIRNSIAHGRIVYKEKLIWPLSPFFNITSNESSMITVQIQFLTARAIALHIGLDIWKNQWEDVYQILPLSNTILKQFIKKIDEHDLMDGIDLLKGTYENITIASLVDYYIENKSQCSFSELEKVLSRTLKEVQINEDNSDQLFLASVLMCDSEDKELSAISQKMLYLFIRMYGMNIPI